MSYLTPALSGKLLYVRYDMLRSDADRWPENAP